jgi:hypothetical protein
MNLSQFEAIFPEIADAGVSIELISAPGRGKSTVIRKLQRKMSELTGNPWGYADLFLATQTPPDLIGYQFKGEMEYGGRKLAITDPTIPTWFICDDGKPVFAYEYGIFHLEEFGQGQTDVKAAAAELFLNKRIGKWRLGDQWVVIASSNRTSDRSGVTKSLDFVINRRIEIHITDDLEALLQWMETNDVSIYTRAFAFANPNIVLSDAAPEKQGPWCTPRSLVLADNVIKARARHHGGKAPLDGVTLELVKGLVGEAAAAQWVATARLEDEMPRLEAICDDPEGVPVPSKPDAQMLIAYNLAHRVTERNASPVVTYLKRMPTDFGMTFIREACRRDAMLVTTPAFQRWINGNAALMACIGK